MPRPYDAASIILGFVLPNPAARCFSFRQSRPSPIDRAEASSYTRVRRARTWGRAILLQEPVAQPVEHVTFNHGVLGSSPSGLTSKIKYLHYS